MTIQQAIFGYNTDNTVNRNEAAIVRMVFYMYVVCELSHERIAFHLNRLGVAGPSERWTALVVYELLTNPAYTGVDAPDILQDVEAWEMAQHGCSKYGIIPAIDLDIEASRKLPAAG